MKTKIIEHQNNIKNNYAFIIMSLGKMSEIRVITDETQIVKQILIQIPWLDENEN